MRFDELRAKLSSNANCALQLATQEAQRLNHDYIGTEHILVGLAKRNDGIHQRLFAAFSVSPEAVMKAVRDLVCVGPDDGYLPGKLPFTPRAVKVLEHASSEANSRSHEWIGTGHLLLGLLQATDGVAEAVLGKFGIIHRKASAALDDFMASPDYMIETGGDPLAGVETIGFAEFLTLTTEDTKKVLTSERRPFLRVKSVSEVQLPANQAATTLEWVRPEDRLPTSEDADELGYVLIATRGTTAHWIRPARWIASEWVDMGNYLVGGVRFWAAMPKLPIQ